MDLAKMANYCWKRWLKATVTSKQEVFWRNCYVRLIMMQGLIK